MNDSDRRLKQEMILAKMAKLIDAGEIKPLLHSKIFSFDEVALAHKALESQGVLGKVVIGYAEKR